MLKRLFSLAAAATAALVSGCGDGPATVPGSYRSPAAASVLVYATSRGPMLIEVHGDPFGLGPALFRTLVAQAMSGATPARPFRFTADPADAPARKVRVVVAFDPTPVLSAADLCAGQVASAAPGRPGERVALLAALCDGDQVLASVSGWVAKVDGPDDRRFRQLLTQAARELAGAGAGP